MANAHPPNLPPLRYHLIVLGLWLEHNAGTPVWRFSLENPLTAERVGFQNLADLMAGLERWMQAPDLNPEMPADRPPAASVSTEALGDTGL